MEKEKREKKRTLSERLYEAVRPEWDKAATQNFVIEMARGTLDPARFRKYMLQDYLYLMEYVEILERIKAQIETQTKTPQHPQIPSEIGGFVERAIAETKREIQSVHIPNMKKIGITESEIKQAVKIKEIADYLEYMKAQTKTGGPLVGLVALLQCSWGYAYIAQTVGQNYRTEIETSAYKSWFDAYTGSDYLKANQEWIDIVDRLAEGEEDQGLVETFVRCAEFETNFWGRGLGVIF